ncbi:MAG: hypothetical protein LBU14_01760 [Candidatus Peribacteria bacterium]|nr:hypothetical protein [Candidatus Peribacteria bacterium]
MYFYTDLILNSYNVNLNTRLNFSKLYNLLENKNFSFSENPLISLGDIYSKLDIKVEDNIQKYNEMYEKLNNSALVLNLNNSSLSENSQSYLISFLYNIIIY